MYIDNFIQDEMKFSDKQSNEHSDEIEIEDSDTHDKSK